MPSLLCYSCVSSLTSAYKFREMCQESERTFASSVVKVYHLIDTAFKRYKCLILEYSKAELKLEPSDDAIQLESDTVEYIYEATNEFIDPDEDIEFETMLEERLEDTIEEAETETVYDDFNGSGDLDEKNILMGNTSDSDYDPSEHMRKPKVRKTRHIKRGRGRPRNSTHAVLKNGQAKPANASTANKSNDEGSTNIMCEICGNIYSKRAALNIHMRRHMAEKPFECEYVCRLFIILNFNYCHNTITE